MNGHQQAALGRYRNAQSNLKKDKDQTGSRAHHELPREALKWYQQGKQKKRYAFAQNNLSWMYQKGLGVVNQDYQEVSNGTQTAVKTSSSSQQSEDVDWIYLMEKN